VTPFFLFAKILLTGGIVLGLELAASRVMTPFFGVSLYVWSAILSVTLTALALGYKFGGILAGRIGRDQTMLFFACSGALAGLWMNLCTWTYPFLFLPLAQFDLVLGSILACVYLLFVPLVILSALNPVLVALLKDESGADHGAGNVFFVSTIGSVLGVFAVAYGLLPYVTNYQSIVILALASSVLSVAALLLMRGNAGGLPMRPFVLSLVSCLIALATLATGGLERQTHEFQHADRTWKLTHAEPSYFGHIQVLDLFDDVGDQISRALLNDGMTQNQFYGPGVSSVLYSYVLERIGLSSARNPKKAFVLGIAAGVVPMAYARAGLEVHAVDINQRMLDVTKEHLDFKPELMKVIVEDARTAARRCEGGYDIVAVDLFRDDGMPEHLVTREFFGDLEGCMNEGGVLVMNSFMNVDHMASQHALLRTIASVFGEVVFLRRTPHEGRKFTSGFLVARKGGPVGELHPSLADMPEPMLEGFQEALARTEIIRPDDAVVAGAPVLTDVSNQWKHLALPVEISYRRQIVDQMPWQILLN